MWGGATSNSRYKHMIDKLKNYWSNGDQRSIKAKRNIALSFGNKIIAIFISLAIVPITIDYLNPEQYGIWLTLSSIVAWISFFDIGLGHGFRNRFAEAKARGDNELARKYVSTTYFTMALIFGVVLVVFECINPFLNWASILNISQEQNQLLSVVVSIILMGVCASFAVNVVSIMLSADQKPALSAMITTAGQGIALLMICVLTQLPAHDMRYIAFALSWTPVIVTLSISLWLFTHKYKAFAPSFRYIDKFLIKNIINLGVKFFVIQVSMILIFQVVNIILSRVLGPTAVTEYNITYKYFSITMMVFNIILSPYWSAFTDAYTKGDFEWMKSIHKKLTRVWFVLALVNIILLAASPLAYKFWLHGSVEVHLATSISMFIYINILSFSTMYMILLNGTGKVFLQMLIYLFCALIAIPSSIALCGNYGISGILIVLSFVYCLQAIAARIQLNKILSNQSFGIWNK